MPVGTLKRLVQKYFGRRAAPAPGERPRAVGPGQTPPGGPLLTAEPMPGEWINVRGRSSNVAGFKYDHQTSTLYVQFLGKGSIYAYYNVPLEVYDDMFTASSFGRFVWTDLRDKFPYAEMTNNHRRLWMLGRGRKPGWAQD